jgi:hypothetical protein
MTFDLTSVMAPVFWVMIGLVVAAAAAILASPLAAEARPGRGTRPAVPCRWLSRRGVPRRSSTNNPRLTGTALRR